MTIRKLLAVFFGACMLTACATPDLSGDWYAQNPQGAYLHLNNDGSLNGFDGCNRMFGQWSSEGSNITFDTLGSTKMYCEGVDTWLSLSATATARSGELQVFNGEGAEIGTLKR